MLDVITEIFYEGEWTDFVVEHFLGGRWLEKAKEEPVYEEYEIGAYTTWFADPSNSVMLHFQNY